jgi:carbamoyl-phosphate synthase small subunit
VTSPPALLVLEDGSAFRGSSIGAKGEAFGEAVFNTAMAGYQEVLTDPSYAGQIVTMTAPHVGNYGLTPEDEESGGVQVAGFVVRRAAAEPSSWRSTMSLHDYLERAGVVGVEGIDTRALTLRLRSAGAMRAGMSTVDLEPESMVERVRRQPSMEGMDLAAAVSGSGASLGPDRADRVDRTGRTSRIGVFDFGLKRTMLAKLAEQGFEMTVFPARTPAATVLASGVDGVFLSNGPGDPAATAYGVEAARTLLQSGVPVFGVCLGHQLLALAAGGRTYKLRFGHRGVNQPVVDVERRRVEITSHNHGFAVDPAGWDGGGPGGPGSETAFGRVAFTHWNLNDGTLEGLRWLDVPAFSVQFHPEAAPGPRDAGHLFDRFRELMA